MKMALWSECELLSLNSQHESWAHQVEKLNENHAGVVQGITMGVLLKQHHRSSIDILKMDIEGAEREIFSSECGWLSRTNVLIVETHDHIKPGCTRALNDAISGLDYERMERGENTIFINRELRAAATQGHSCAAEPA